MQPQLALDRRSFLLGIFIAQAYLFGLPLCSAGSRSLKDKPDVSGYHTGLKTPSRSRAGLAEPDKPRRLEPTEAMLLQQTLNNLYSGKLKEAVDTLKQLVALNPDCLSYQSLEKIAASQLEGSYWYSFQEKKDKQALAPPLKVPLQDLVLLRLKLSSWLASEP